MNKTEYKDLAAFHPGYYVAEIIEDMGISQDEFATRLGTTGKTVSKLVNGQCNISNDLAQKLATMLGTGTEVWINLQAAYYQKEMEIDQQKKIDEQIDIVSMIDYRYFIKVGHLNETKDDREKVVNLCSFFKVSDLRIMLESDLLVNFRAGIPSLENKNIVNARAWVQTALNISKTIPVSNFNAERLKNALPEIRQMTIQAPEIFLPRLKEIFADCGVAFVLLPYLKNSGINGAVKWSDANHVLLALNDRKRNADTFWFSLFHEIKHVLQQKIKTVFISFDLDGTKKLDDSLEEEANKFAQDYLIPPAEFQKFSPSLYTSDAEICNFAKKIGIHPGIVAGRLQREKIIPQNRCSKLKEQYQIVI